LQLTNEPLYFSLAVELIEVVSSEFRILLCFGDNMVDNNQEGMTQSHSRSLLPTTNGNMVVMGREVTLLAVRGCVRGFDESCAQPLAAFACLSA